MAMAMMMIMDLMIMVMMITAMDMVIMEMMIMEMITMELVTMIMAMMTLTMDIEEMATVGIDILRQGVANSGLRAQEISATEPQATIKTNFPEDHLQYQLVEMYSKEFKQEMLALISSLVITTMEYIKFLLAISSLTMLQ